MDDPPINRAKILAAMSDPENLAAANMAFDDESDLAARLAAAEARAERAEADADRLITILLAAVGPVRCDPDDSPCERCQLIFAHDAAVAARGDQ